MINNEALNLPLCVIVGAGPGNGMAMAERFQQDGFRVALIARNLAKLQSHIDSLPGPDNLYAYAADVTQPEQITSVFNLIREQHGEVNVLIYNAGNAVFDNIDNASVTSLEKAWEINVRGLYLATKEVLPDMQKNHAGNIVVVGATASVKASANFLSFTSAKGGQRHLAQSMAKYLGPQNIHVSYMIIDGVIDTPMTRSFLPGKSDEFFLQAKAIAGSAAHLVAQPPSAWTFELDLRPFAEKW